MKSRTLLLVVAANLAVLLTLTFFVPQLMISPGTTIDAHGEIASDCFACHSAFIGSTPEKCIACHKIDEISLVTTKGEAIAREKKNVGFHQKLVEEDCVACHSDHRGVKPFRPISQFSHQLLDPVLQEECDSCHSNPDDSLHRKIKGNCGQCHTPEAWTPATFDHDEFFYLDRDHDAACETCHVDNNFADYTCYGCHEHSRSKIREEHFEEGIRDYESCVECHRSADEDEAKRIWRSKRFDGRTQIPFANEGYRVREYERDDDDD
jgi:hypothetical protein